MRIFALLAWGICATAQAQVSVDELATRATLVDGQTHVRLVIKNEFPESINASATIEWLDIHGEQVVQARIPFNAAPGASTAEAPLPLPDNSGDANFYRLRYSVSPAAANLTAFRPFSGIIALPQIAGHAFTLRVLGIGTPRPGIPYEFRVFAAQSVTGQPIAGAQVKMQDVDGATATTDQYGAAVIRTTLNEDDSEPTFEARLGDFHQAIDVRLADLPKNEIRIYNDKPLYQPGQTMHLRLLAIGADGRARAGAGYTMRVRDPRNTVMHAEQVTTSTFGIAHTDWEIPPNAQAGKYSIEVQDADDSDITSRQIEVRPYELPSFRVAVQPDRPYYSVAQAASVQVRADYLFGKPVATGKVRISHGEEEEAVVEGAFDSNGQFRSPLSLNAGKENLSGARFVDLHFTAYVTDAGTNRTEQRKFDIRVTRDPIHIYVVREDQSTISNRLYIAAYTPDGKPLVSDLAVTAAGHSLAKARTNRFGLARIDVPPSAEQILITAGAGGNTASLSYSAMAVSKPHLVIETNRSLYRAGESIDCRIVADRPDLQATVLVWGEDARVHFTRAFALHDGKAEIKIPYDAGFGRALTLAVISTLGAEFHASKTVLFPGAEELKITARPAKDSYRPGEAASVAFQASDRSGAPVKAALGVAVVDGGVFERAAADALDHSRLFDATELRGLEIAGFAKTDLLALNPAKLDSERQLLAEALLENPRLSFEDPSFTESERTAFADAARHGLDNLQQRLDAEYISTLDYPRDEDTLRRIAGPQFDRAVDPWEQPYRVDFSTHGAYDEIRLLSAGPDKKFGDEDDIEALTIQREWLLPIKSIIRSALDRLDDYPATTAEFLRVVGDAGIRFEALRDPWGHPLRARIAHRYDKRIVEIRSAGPPDVATVDTDGLVIASFTGTFFRAMDRKIDRAVRAAPSFPADAAQFRAALSADGLNLDDLRDPWGRPYSIGFRTDSSFGDSVQFYTYADFEGLDQQRKQITPVKRTFRLIYISSAGRDGIPNTSDDFVVAKFSQLISDHAAPSQPAQAAAALPTVSVGGRGTVAGVVHDRSGAAIPNATVVLNGVYQTATNASGAFYFRGVPPGMYIIQIESPGFERRVVGNVPVRADQVTRVDSTLELGTVSQSVEVSDTAFSLETSSAELAALPPGLSSTSTPRVRDYFPETLLWNPELLTNQAGRAALDFKMADSITTWRVAVIASTEDGRVAETSADIKAFQPFFVDLDPPQMLTAGDQVSLPVPVRNYLLTQQNVSMQATAAPALAISNAKQTTTVAPSTSANASLHLTAVAAANHVRLRVAAIANGAADAIEKPIDIHPDGEPVARSVSDLLANSRLLRIDVPAGIIAGSMRAEVKIYPGLLSHLIESMGSILQRPSGCGEQIISSSYPNLLVLRGLNNSGLTDAALEARARRNLAAGYQKLLALRTNEGGFGYWSHSSSDVTITAYAIGFLEDAAGLIAVDSDVLTGARTWLASQNPETASVNAVALRALAKSGPKFESKLVDRLGEFARRAARMDEPYAIATFALAAIDAGKPELAEPAIGRLRGLVREEQGAAYWHMPTNTPFFGWGPAGRIETTALAVSALSRWRKHAGADTQLSALIDRGVLFLIRNQDPTGVWFSSQATVRVFAAMLDTLANADTSKAYTAEVLVNGASAGRMQIPGGRGLGHPLTLDVSGLIRPGVANEVLISAPQGSAAAQAQFSATWYQTWNGPTTSPELSLQVRYSATKAAPNQAIQCDVNVSRPAFRGYGMMIAEVGLPPGVEVDRGTLAELLEHSDSGVDSFEIAPGKVVLYLWPRANDSKFTFIFRPRYPMSVLLEPSLLYDYYNPDSRAALPPSRLTVR